MKCTTFSASMFRSKASLPAFRTARSLLIAALLAASSFANAQLAASDPQAPAAIAQPSALALPRSSSSAGSIQSIDDADQALSEAAKSRTEIEAQYLRDQRECQPKFFTTRCLDDAKERRRSAIAKIRTIEIDANSYKRRDRVVERDKALEERRIKDASGEQERLKLQVEADAKLATKAAVVGDSGKLESGSEESAQEAKLKAERTTAAKSAPSPRAQRPEPRPQKKIDAATQAANIAAYEKKAADAAAHQRAVIVRKAEKEAERARNAAAKITAAGAPAASAAAVPKSEKVIEK
ncbi:hypothetical protein BH11PSE11_BH11PSE11_03830 [soil metagenome]